MKLKLLPQESIRTSFIFWTWPFMLMSMLVHTYSGLTQSKSFPAAPVMRDCFTSTGAISNGAKRMVPSKYLFDKLFGLFSYIL